MLITNNGRVLVGAVTPQVLYQAAAQPAPPHTSAAGDQVTDVRAALAGPRGGARRDGRTRRRRTRERRTRRRRSLPPATLPGLPRPRTRQARRWPWPRAA